MFLVVTIEKNVINEIQYMGEDREKAELAFLATLRECLTNWDEYTPGDVEAILVDGFESYGKGAVNFIDTDDWESADILGRIDREATAKRGLHTVTCKVCNMPTPSSAAHLHQGDWIGDDCCWDERLRSSE